MELVEGAEGELLCSAVYEDGATELFPYTEARERVAGGEAAAGGAAALSAGAAGGSAEAVEAMAAVASFASAWLTHRGAGGLVRVEAPPAMLAACQLLHDSLFELSGLDGLACQEAIARVCEAWWADERAGAEMLMPQLLPYLLVQALGDEARDADVKRLFAVTHAAAAAAAAAAGNSGLPCAAAGHSTLPRPASLTPLRAPATLEHVG